MWGVRKVRYGTAPVSTCRLTQGVVVESIHHTPYSAVGACTSAGAATPARSGRNRAAPRRYT
jgi:hypothetical protein